MARPSLFATFSLIPVASHHSTGLARTCIRRATSKHRTATAQHKPNAHEQRPRSKVRENGK
eukprot:4137792-Prymnesium_polylepis.1